MAFDNIYRLVNKKVNNFEHNFGDFWIFDD